MEWILYATGSIMVLVAGVDVFLTVLYARSGTGLLSPRTNRLIWYLFRQSARRCGRRKHTILSFCGPITLVILLALWILMISLDTISLFKSALNEERYYKQLNSAAAEALWNSGIRLMMHFAGTMLPKNSTVQLQIDHEMNHAQWRTHYYGTLKKLQRHGVETRNDPREGLREYIRYRMQWDPYVIAFARLMLYDEQDVFSYRHNN
jgi:hypothetical protein